MKRIDHKLVQKFNGLEFLAKQVVEGFITGLHKSPLHGFSVEFAEHRLYNKGESTRHIDWKLYARTDKLFVKRYEEETNLRCQLVIDTSSSMNFPEKELLKKDGMNKLTFSVYSAASLIYLLKKQRDAVGLTLFSDTINLRTETKTSNVHHKLLFSNLDEILQNPSENKKTFAIDALHQVAESLHKRSLVILFSDMMDNSTNFNALFSALQHLRHKKHEVILFHVADKNRELELNFENRPYTFVDMESGEEVKVNPNQIKKSYLANISKFEKDLKLKCSQFKIDFVEADINMGFDVILKSFLAKRANML